MNVYDHIAANDRKTLMILFAFPVTLFVAVFLSLCAAGFLEVLTTQPRYVPVAGQAMKAAWEIFPWILLGAFLWIVFCFYAGGEVVLKMTHARSVTLDENRDLFRLVENTAIMAGLPTPEIYLIKDESLNAFAVGRNPKAASIALTSGIVKKLDKIELQTVIAHELAHIGNHDTLLMMFIIAGIGFFTFFGELLCRSAFRRGRRSGGKGGGKDGRGALILFAIGIACLVFGYVVAPILRFAISRRREFQADATAAKITRDPEALARALTKIAADPRVEVLDANPLVGNLCIANPSETWGFAGFENRLYSTHPSIEARVAALENMMGKDGESQVTAPVGKAIW